MAPPLRLHETLVSARDRTGPVCVSALSALLLLAVLVTFVNQTGSASAEKLLYSTLAKCVGGVRQRGGRMDSAFC